MGRCRGLFGDIKDQSVKQAALHSKPREKKTVSRPRLVAGHRDSMCGIYVLTLPEVHPGCQKASDELWQALAMPLENVTR